GKKFALINNGSPNCLSKNVIYVITCKKCRVQYVGETSMTLRDRMRCHKKFILGQKHHTYVVRHFNSAGHSINDLQIQIIETLAAGCNKRDLENREDFWIRVLNTAYPFGLNDKIKGYGSVSLGINPLESNKHPYFCVKLPPRPRHTHGV